MLGELVPAHEDADTQCHPGACSHRGGWVLRAGTIYHSMARPLITAECGGDHFWAGAEAAAAGAGRDRLSVAVKPEVPSGPRGARSTCS